VIGIAFSPLKTDSPLIVYPNAVLAFPNPLQFLQSISRGNEKLGKLSGSMDHEQLASTSTPDVVWQLLRPNTMKNGLSIGICE